MLNKIFLDVAVITAVSTVLAILLVLAEKFLNNYGECDITVNDKRKLTVKGGNNLLGSLGDKQVYLPSACGGRGSCGACKCQVFEGGGPLLPTEKPFLSQAELKDNYRLSCQVKVKSNISIGIPDSIFNIRKFNSVIESIVDYTHDIKGIVFKLEPGDTIDFKAGQYVQLITEPYAKMKQRVSRAYSIASKPELNDRIELIIRLVPEGICTTWVHNYLQVGDKVNFTGPYGDFFIRDTDADIIFVAGGSGKAPIKSMLEHLEIVGTNRKMNYFFGARTLDDLYLTDEMRRYESVFPDFHYEPVLSNPGATCPWDGKCGYVMPYIKEVMRDPANTEAYLCGSPVMIDSVTKTLLELGIPKNKIYFDSFG